MSYIIPDYNFYMKNIIIIAHSMGSLATITALFIIVCLELHFLVEGTIAAIIVFVSLELTEFICKKYL